MPGLSVNAERPADFRQQKNEHKEIADGQWSRSFQKYGPSISTAAIECEKQVLMMSGDSGTLLQKMLEEDDFPADLLKNMMQETLDDRGENKSPAFDRKPVFHPGPHPLGNYAEKVSRNLEPLFENALKNQTKIKYQSATSSTFENLFVLAAERSYYSLFVTETPRSVWVLHLQRPVAEGLASVLRDSKRSGMDFRFSEADAAVYLEIGRFLKEVINQITLSGLPKPRLKVLQIRHMLHPGFSRLVEGEEEYQLLEFSVQNPVATGTIQVAIPDIISKMLHT